MIDYAHGENFCSWFSLFSRELYRLYEWFDYAKLPFVGIASRVIRGITLISNEDALFRRFKSDMPLAYDSLDSIDDSLNHMLDNPYVFGPAAGYTPNLQSIIGR